MDLGTWTEYAKFFAALTAVVNPVGIIPVFIDLTAGERLEERTSTGLWAAIATAVILLLALLTGEAFLRFFGISIASFRVGGGILILLMSISMMHAKMSSVRQSEEERLDVEDRRTVAVVPLGTPLLAGPGAISTVILYAQRYSSVGHYAILACEICLLALITLAVFRAAPIIAAFLGKTGINVVTRIMGLIMAAVAVEFIANGLKQLFPVLAS